MTKEWIFYKQKVLSLELCAFLQWLGGGRTLAGMIIDHVMGTGQGVATGYM